MSQVFSLPADLSTAMGGVFGGGSGGGGGGDLPRKGGSEPERFHTVHRLTNHERRVAEALMEGRRPATSPALQQGERFMPQAIRSHIPGNPLGSFSSEASTSREM